MKQYYTVHFRGMIEHSDGVKKGLSLSYNLCISVTVH